MSVGGGQMQPEWVELDARIAALANRLCDLDDVRARAASEFRQAFSELRGLIAERTPEHVAAIERAKGLRAA